MKVESADPNHPIVHKMSFTFDRNIFKLSPINICSFSWIRAKMAAIGLLNWMVQRLNIRKWQNLHSESMPKKSCSNLVRASLLVKTALATEVTIIFVGSCPAPKLVSKLLLKRLSSELLVRWVKLKADFVWFISKFCWLLLSFLFEIRLVSSRLFRSLIIFSLLTNSESSWTISSANSWSFRNVLVLLMILNPNDSLGLYCFDSSSSFLSSKSINLEMVLKLFHKLLQEIVLIPYFFKRWILSTLNEKIWKLVRFAFRICYLAE